MRKQDKTLRDTDTNRDIQIQSSRANRSRGMLSGKKVKRKKRETLKALGKQK